MASVKLRVLIYVSIKNENSKLDENTNIFYNIYRIKREELAIMENQKIQDEEKLKEAKRRNVKLYPIYKMFAWDLLFYYPIYFLFLSQNKGLSASEIVLGNAFYTIFKLIFQPFVPMIVGLLGKRKSTVLGNIFVTISILYVILAKGSLKNYIIFNLIQALGYIFKNVCEASILDECITDKEKKNTIFTKYDGKGSAYWYTFEAVSAVFTGFLFVVNAYIPMYLCFIFCIIGTILSTKFEHYEHRVKIKKEKDRSKTLKEKMDLAIQEYKFIFKSKRLRALYMFSGVLYGLLYIRASLTSSLLVEINIPDQFFGIITGIFTIFAALTTWQQHFIQKRLKNKVLTVFGLTYAWTLILSAIVIILKLDYKFTLIVTFIMLTLQNMIKGPYYTLIKRYLNSFSDKHLSTKIYAINGIVEDVGGIIISLAVSLLLEHTTTAYTSLILGIVSLILFIIILDYMKTRIGLAPEEYDKKDIEFKQKVKEPPIEQEKKQEVEIIVGINDEGNSEAKIIEN